VEPPSVASVASVASVVDVAAGVDVTSVDPPPPLVPELVADSLADAAVDPVSASAVDPTSESPHEAAMRSTKASDGALLQIV